MGIVRINIVFALFLTVTAFAMEKAVEKQQAGDKATFFICWKSYVERYVEKNNIKLDENNTKAPLVQWAEGFNKFKERLEKIEPVYSNWRKALQPQKTVSAAEEGGFFSRFFDPKKNISKIDEQPKIEERIDFDSVGECHWLMVALGLAPRYEYSQGKFSSETTFLENNKQLLKDMMTFERSDNSTIIASTKTFFTKDFVTKGKETIEKDKKKLMYNDSSVYIDCLKLEGHQWSKNLKWLSENILNSGVVLLPGENFITIQPSYARLYARLIQYALVYLVDEKYYAECLKKKIQNLYQDSWLAKDHPIFFANPYADDAVHKMTNDPILKNFKETNKKTDEWLQDLAKGQKSRKEKSLEMDTEFAKSKDEREKRWEEAEKWDEESLKKEVQRLRSFDLLAGEKKSSITASEKPKNSFWSRFTTGIKNIWTRYKNWLFGGTAVAVGTYAVWKYFKQSADR